MLLSVTDIIDILTLFQLLLLTCVLFITKRGRRQSNVILAVFFLIQSGCLMNGFVWRYYNWFHTHCPHLFYIHMSPLLLLGPALYLFTRSWTSRGSVFRKTDLLFSLPFFAHFLFFYFRFHRYSGLEKQLLLSGNRVMTLLESRILDHALFLVLIVFGVLTVRQLIRYRQELRMYCSSTLKYGLNWLIFVDAGFMGLWLAEILDYYYFLWQGGHSVIVHIVHPIVFILATIMVLKALIHPDIFVLQKNGAKHEKYQMSGKQRAVYLKKLLQTMNSQKPYMNPELTLKELSDLADIPPRYLSQILNESLKQNYYEFINRYRIEASKEYLSDPEKQKCTILEILYEVGFNSKVAFNTAFKKYIGMTPRHYRRSCHLPS